MEIDLDSVFNNLLVNSIDSFLRQKQNNKREIMFPLIFFNECNSNAKAFIFWVQ
jgi:hypothetical protein